MLYNEDCLHTLKRMPDASVDLFLQDTPFGVTQNDWDIKPNLPEMWVEWLRVAKPKCPFIFFATQPFASELVMSNPKIFKYDLIWDKAQCTGFLNANKMPLRNHETLIVFYRELPTYNPQKLKGKRQLKSTGGASSNYGNFDCRPHYSEDYFPKSIIDRFPQVREANQHPTQKPMDLFRYLIATYTNEGDTVFDGYMGSGTTALACIDMKRKWIGAELNKGYFEEAITDIENAQLQNSLF